MNIESDWPYIRYLKLKTSESIVCPICLTEKEHIIIPKILRCHHIFCFTCLVTYFLEFKQNCPICARSICLKEVKSIRIDTVKFSPGDTVDWVLMKKNIKNHKVDFVDGSAGASINFVNKIQSISIEEYEHMIFGEVQELHSNKELSEIDPLILDFCQFIILKSVGDHLKFAAPPFLGKRALLMTNKTLKEDYVYFYQSVEGVNTFMHPLDLDYLMEYYGDVNELPGQLSTRITAVQKIVQ